MGVRPPRVQGWRLLRLARQPALLAPIARQAWTAPLPGQQGQGRVLVHGPPPPRLAAQHGQQPPLGNGNDRNGYTMCTRKKGGARHVFTWKGKRFYKVRVSGP